MHLLQFSVALFTLKVTFYKTLLHKTLCTLRQAQTQRFCWVDFHLFLVSIYSFLHYLILFISILSSSFLQVLYFSILSSITYLLLFCPSVLPFCDHHPLQLYANLFSLSLSLYLSVKSSIIYPSLLSLGFLDIFLLSKITASVPVGKFFLIKCHSHTLTFKDTHKHLTPHTCIHTHTHMHISKKPVFVLIKRQAGSKMNCNDFQAVLMANKSWIRKLTRTSSISLSLSQTHTHTCTHTHPHTNTPTQGHVSWRAALGSFRSQMGKVLSCFLLLMTLVLTFIITAWKEISRN